MRVPSHASVSKYYADKTYANLWFILLQVTKGFRFQNKNVRFISGNFSSHRFSWKVKTIRYGLHILISKHLEYRCLEFTILKCTWWIFAKKKILTWVQDQNLLFTFLANDYEAKFRQIAFSESVRISHGQHLPPKFFSESHNWIKSCILIGLRSEEFSVELRVENEAKWYCFAST